MREIGSDFEFPVRSLLGHRGLGAAAFAGPDAVFLGSGRDALHWIIRAVALPPGARALLPAYLCEEVVKPFRLNGIDVDFYRLTSDLQVDEADLADRLSSDTRFLLYIHYFGFPLPVSAELADKVAPGTLVIEDSSHAFLSRWAQPPLQSDFRFASLRKLLPVPDGACVSWGNSRTASVVPPRTRVSPGFLGTVALWTAGALLKSLWLRRLRIFPKRLFRRLFAWSGVLLDRYPRPAPISIISRRLLNRIEFEEVVRTRRRNFQLLLEGLVSSDALRPLHTTLPEGVCPLGFPVLAEDRGALARHLIARQIYTPVHWELPQAVDRDEFESAWWVSDHVLTIPIDQRYDEEDMERIVDVLRSYRGAEVLWPAGR